MLLICLAPECINSNHTVYHGCSSPPPPAVVQMELTWSWLFTPLAVTRVWSLEPLDSLHLSSAPSPPVNLVLAASGTRLCRDSHFLLPSGSWAYHTALHRASHLKCPPPVPPEHLECILNLVEWLSRSVTKPFPLEVPAEPGW